MAQTTGELPFVLSRISITDLPELVSLEFDCFPPFIRQIFLGCDTKDELFKIQRVYAQNMRDDPYDIWTKVVDRESGKIIAASNWKVHINGISNGGVGDEPLPWLDGETYDKSKEICDKMKTFDNMKYVLPWLWSLIIEADLHICFTDPKYRRRGAGGLMLQWGCDLADQLGLPGWIEASEEGNFLYKAFGFYDFEKIEGEMAGTNMKRDAKLELSFGGKPK